MSASQFKQPHFDKNPAENKKEYDLVIRKITHRDKDFPEKDIPPSEDHETTFQCREQQSFWTTFPFKLTGFETYSEQSNADFLAEVGCF